MIDWKPTADIGMLQRRAQMLARVRAFFSARNVMEVDVPIMALATVTDPNIESFVVASAVNTSKKYYLMTSPEFYMKRLLAAGYGSIYYLGKAFRAEEAGSRHSPEFTMLEWYRPEWSLNQLMTEVLELVSEFVAGVVRYTTYKKAFMDTVNVDPHRASLADLKSLAQEKLSPAFDTDDRGVWLDLLFSHLVEPNLQGLVFVEQFPSAQAALAQTVVDGQGNQVASRFELYINGIEIANGYQEELDVDILSARFADNMDIRKFREQALPSADKKFLAAMSAGIPVCAGVALGLDRLLMATVGEKKIASVVPFADF